ncbi:MAG: hypothetical protein AAFU79_06560 [Myxococcota bacterium]
MISALLSTALAMAVPSEPAVPTNCTVIRDSSGFVSIFLDWAGEPSLGYRLEFVFDSGSVTIPASHFSPFGEFGGRTVWMPREVMEHIPVEESGVSSDVGEVTSLMREVVASATEFRELRTEAYPEPLTTCDFLEARSYSEEPPYVPAGLYDVTQVQSGYDPCPTCVCPECMVRWTCHSLVPSYPEAWTTDCSDISTSDLNAEEQDAYAYGGTLWWDFHWAVGFPD